MSGLTICGMTDGFGAQLMAMLSGIAYCKHHDIPYVHTPIQHILPSGTFATDMDDQVVQANEFVDAIIERLKLDRQLPIARSAPHMHDHINKDPDAYYTPEFTKFLASGYRLPRPGVFAGHFCNIVVHVRRGDIGAEQSDQWVASEDILLQMNRLRDFHPGAHFHVFSWKDPCTELDGDDVTIHCSENGTDFLNAFNCFVHADVLIIGASGLSMAAALFNTKKVIAPTANRKRTNWANRAIPARWYWDPPEPEYAHTRPATQRSTDIDLRDMKIFVISMKKDLNKRFRLIDLLRRHGFTDIEIVPGQELSSPDIIGCVIAHAKVLYTYRPETPFIVMEDDLTFTEDFTPHLTVPDNADCIYLGHSRFGIVPAYNPKFGLWDGFICADYDEVYFRIYNMLAAHCILYLTNRYVETVRREVVNYLLDRDFAMYHDVAFAKLQKSFNVFTPRRLQTYQTEEYGGNEVSTNFELRATPIRGTLALTHLTPGGIYPFNLAPDELYPNVVTVDLVGGLGNTLFTVAAAYAYAKSRNAELVIGEKEFIEGHCSEVSPHYPDGWPVYWDTIYRKLLVAKLNTDAFQHVEHWDPQGFISMEDLIGGEAPMVCLQGYFQNVRYFDNYRDDLIALFKEPPNHIRYYIETKYRLNEYDRVLIIGVRQSKDYEQNGWLLPASYYVNAYQHFCEQCRDDRVLAIAIADEIGWVETNLSPHIPDLVIVDERENGLELHMSVVQFYIMMRGTDFILSNSTFHWWGAYLAETEMILSPADHRNPHRVFIPKQDQYREIDADPIPESMAATVSGGRG